MEYKELGRTGVMIPEVGLGTWKYRGGPEPLRRGIELGATLIDTAEMYRTEDAVGQAIRGIRDRVFVATKVLGSNLRYDDVMRAAEKSLRLLDDPVIDLYQIHWPSRSVPIAETMRAMETLADRGVIKLYRRQQLLGGRYAGSAGRDVQVPDSLQPGAVQPEAAAHRAGHHTLLRREPHHGDGLYPAGRRLPGRAPPPAGWPRVGDAGSRRPRGRQDAGAGGAQLVPDPRAGGGHPQDQQRGADGGELRRVGLAADGGAGGEAGGGVSALI